MASVQEAIRNRRAAWRLVGWVLAVAPWVMVAVMMGGCEQTVQSPISGQQVTADQLVREADAEARKLEREAADKAETAKKRIEAAKFEARSRIREIRGNVEATAAESARVIESVQDELGVRVAEAETDFGAAVSRLEAETADLEARTTGALQAIEAKRQRVAGLFDVVKNIPVVGQAAASAGLDLGGLGALVLGGGGALAWQARRGRKLADQAWDDAKKEAAEAKEREDRAWDSAQSEMLRLLTTLPKAP